MTIKTAVDLLEFNKLLEIISMTAHSDASRKAILDIFPMNNKEEIIKRLGQIENIRRISHEGSPLKFNIFKDLSYLFKKIRPEGAVFDSYELSAFLPVLETAYEISLQGNEKGDIPFLKEITEHLTGHPDILDILRKSIDSEGNILDSASFLISDLRKKIKRLEYKIQKKLEEMIRDNKISVFLQDNFITQRSGRWVIPVRMDSKGQVPGVVHDVSNTGETVFIEPLGILNLSHELENFVVEAKAEEIRITRELSSMIRAKADEMEKEYKIIVYLDALNCISQFADTMHMQNPHINEAGTIIMVNARHPLLVRSFQKSGVHRDVVPLDVSLGDGDTIMVITGSNAGGKTISIKTIGLLLLMALSGMPVPADASSSFPIVSNILLDIGDEQSIENNLSTFSAHVSNIAGILRGADSKTIILIDELGTGTDPDEGTAISCAVLKEIQKRGALVFATTNLAGIKVFVHMTEGMLNASMQFDQKSLTPLYRLRIGEPGQSHALEIARKYGLPDNIIDSAREMVGGIKIEFDNLIADLNEKRERYEKALAELSQQKIQLDNRVRIIEQKIAETESRQKEMLENAYKEASEIISDIKRQMYLHLEEVKKGDKARIRESIKKAEQMHRGVIENVKRYVRKEDEPPAIEEIQLGDMINIKSLGYDAKVIKIIHKNRRVRVRAGSMEMEIPLTDIGSISGKSLTESNEDKFETVSPVDSVSSSIRLVGLRVSEALSRLEPFLNHASLAGLHEVVIIHGVGKGLLARAVRDHLKGHPLVKEYRKGKLSEGGNGVTVVTLV